MGGKQRGRGRAKNYNLPLPHSSDVNQWVLWILVLLLYENYEHYSKTHRARGGQHDLIWNAIESLDPRGTLRTKAEWLR